ncbi:MAG: DNA helicase RecQ [Cytophagales bacterium]
MSVADDQIIELKNNLKRVFGYDNFRGTQEAIINNIMDGKNTFVIMPTGAGKSLCYQLPAIMKEGTAIVISPLIALMKNQVDQLVAFGVNAQFLNSTLNKSEITKVKSETLEGKVKLLYVAPESLTKEENIEFLQKANISLVAIDEAHCISEWGHDFRPEYRKIKHIVEKLGDNIPIIALTATATPKVQQDIIKNLHMDGSTVFKSSFNRKNLYYEIRTKKEDIDKQIIRYIKENKGKSGIIYCLSRKRVEEVADLLKLNGVNALPYHAGLDSNVRMKNQDAFLNEDVEVVVATIAFGMGIDKPDVRFVIHYDAPKSLEGYYQETGRAGRDGMEGKCIMFYNPQDIEKLDKFNKDKPVSEKDNARNLLMEISSYAESSVCRRRLLLHYFGEHLDKDCGYCDNCMKPKIKFEGMEEVLLALKAVVLTENRFTVSHLVDVLRGEMNEYVESYKHDDLDIYGEGDEKDEEYWSSIYRQLLVMEYLEKDIDNYGVVKITKKGLDFIKKPTPIQLTKDAPADAEEKEPVVAGKAYDEELLSQLKALLKRKAKAEGIPPYAIFQETALEEMATTYPTKEEDLLRINGVGQGKAQKFGKDFLNLINKYVKENDIITVSDVTVKSNANKSKLKIYIIQQIDRKIDLEEICEAKELTPEDLISEIENICFSGTKLNLDYYIDQILDYEKQDEIFDYFMNADDDTISKAFDYFGGDYAEEDLRLMRVKFMSEVAN